MSGYLGTKAVLLSTTAASVGGDSTIGGDLTVDTNTLYVDSTNNRVGIGNTSPTQALDVTGDIITSGGVYLGGTTSANLLDDYEEGTWTPTFQGSTTAGTYTYWGQDGAYIKVGNMVTVSFRLTAITTSSAGSGYIQIAGVPFVKAANNQLHQGAVRLQSFDWDGSLYTYGVVEFISGSSVDELYVRLNGDNTAGQDLQISHLLSGSSAMYGQVTYFV